jgi:hypothetical protein
VGYFRVVRESLFKVNYEENRVSVFTREKELWKWIVIIVQITLNCMHKMVK